MSQDLGKHGYPEGGERLHPLDTQGYTEESSMFPIDFQRLQEFKQGIEDLCKIHDIRLIAFEVTEFNGEEGDGRTPALPAIKMVCHQRNIVKRAS